MTPTQSIAAYVVLFRRWLFAICSFLALSGAAAAQQTVVILDASSSMRTELQGDTRLHVAKAAVRDAVSSIHAEAPDHRMGLVSFYDGCWVDPMTRVAPLRSNKDTIIKNVDNLKTREYGHTPIARALEVAADLLKGEGGSLILVSDGEETCEPDRDLCALAKVMRAQNIELKVHLIALSLNKRQLDALTCIPKTTGGSFVSVDNRQELKAALSVAAEIAVQSGIPRCYDNRGGIAHYWCGD